jgi:putative lipoprotein
MKKAIITLMLVVLLAGTIAGCAAPTAPTPEPTPTPTPTPEPTPTPDSAVTGTVAYREKMALPPGAIVEIKLQDVSKQDAPAVVIGEQTITTTGNQVPFPFEIKYDPAAIDPRFTYAVMASITVDGELWFTTDTTYAVITGDNPTEVDLVLKRVVAETPPVEDALAGTAAEIADKIFAQAGVESFGMTQSLATDDAREFYLGSKDYPEFADSAAVTPMINLDTRMLHIIKAANKGDVEIIKTKLEENIDPNRLVCVTFTLEDLVIESRGLVIFMTINSDAEQRAALVAAFMTIE